MKIKRTRTISHLLLAMIATASASGVLSPASVQAQDSNDVIVCQVVDGSKTSLTCLLCDASFWYRLFNPWRCAGCTKPYAPTW